MSVTAIALVFLMGVAVSAVLPLLTWGLILEARSHVNGASADWPDEGVRSRAWPTRPGIPWSARRRLQDRAQVGRGGMSVVNLARSWRSAALEQG